MAVPGPSVVFAMARTVEGGRAAGLVSVLGLEAGLTVHVLAAATGLAAVMHSSDVAFVAVRYVGAGYLLVMGLRQLVGPGGASSAPALTDRQSGGRWHPGRIFRQACMVDLLNPGTILFLAAYLPQFVDTGSGASGTQLLGLGAVVVAVATLCDVAWVLGTAEVVARVRRRRHPEPERPRRAPGGRIGLPGPGHPSRGGVIGQTGVILGSRRGLRSERPTRWLRSERQPREVEERAPATEVEERAPATVVEERGSHAVRNLPAGG